MMIPRLVLPVLLLTFFCSSLYRCTAAFSLQPSVSSTTTAIRTRTQLSPLFATLKPKKKYEPKWKKKATLTEKMGAPPAFEEVGIKGDIRVMFRQGNATKTTLGMRGQPLRDVATQAGQFIKYGCGKGECGTCEALVNGKWIRPCTAVVPADATSTEDFVVIVKEIKNKAKSSGKFFSFRSFIMGFWNNLLGMAGLVRDRRAAKKNWEERRAYEDLVKQRTLEKKLGRQQQQNGQQLKP